MELLSEYNLDQALAVRTIRSAIGKLDPGDLQYLKEKIHLYLEFRGDADRFQSAIFGDYCTETCYKTGESACCGFESIFTFFADHAINCIVSGPVDLDRLAEPLQRQNSTGRCVYLGTSGCLWRVRPISCAMFFCDRARLTVFGADRSLEREWTRLQHQEKQYTFPDRPVLFDWLEEYFMSLGLDTPHMYYHRSPGLMRVKARAGLIQIPGHVSRPPQRD